MSTKFKTMIRKQISFASKNVAVVDVDENESGKTPENNERLMKNTMSFNSDEVILRKKNTRRRHRTSLGVLEDLIKCPICKKMLQSPRMLPCQHTFCIKCLRSKLDESPIDKENIFRCPVCKSETKSFILEKLPPNRSIESVLRAVDSSFIEVTSQSLHVNFAPLSIEARRKSVRCSQCETANEPVDACLHCNQVFCRGCEVQHVAQLKNQYDKIIDQLQVTSNKLNHQILDFKEKTDNLKNTVTKEFDAKIAALHEEKHTRLCAIDDFKIKGENSAIELKQRILTSQADLAQQSDDFDKIGDDKEKIDKFLEVHRKVTDLISSALNWQIKVDDVIETKTVDITRPREKENVKNPYKSKVIYDRKELQRPSGITLDTLRGDIYVTCSGSAIILVFDSQYRLIRRIQNTNLMAPQGIAFVESLQEIFITDKWKHKIYVFTRKGNLVRQIGSKGQARGQLRCPEGIAVLQSRNWIYVADTGNDRVQILGVDGTYKGAIGPPEKRAMSNNPQTPATFVSANGTVLVGVHSFSQPTDVAVSSSAIVVADCGHHKIKVFNHKGQLVFSIGGFGPFKGLFKSPEVVEFDENGNIVVGDSDNGRIQVFTRTGSYLRTYGIQGTLVGHFGAVSGLLILPNNEILVSDSKKNTLELI